MRKVMPILLVVALWLGAGGSALADGMILPEALSPDYLAVRTHHVTVTIDDNQAVTHVEQEFYNPYDITVGGRYLFPLPPDAILSGFRAEVDGVAPTITRQDAVATNADLYAILTERRDPSLLQYADWESLAFDLSLPPGGSRRMTLEYEEVLAPSGGLYCYRYVLSTERYSALPLDDVSVTVDLSSSYGLASVYSPSHVVSVERLGSGQARVRWQAQDVNPSEDLELFFAPGESGFGGGLLTGERNGQDHFLFLFSPQADLSRTEALPKDIVFITDRSGSMQGEKIEQARDALHYILGQLGEADRFSIVAFDDHLSILADELQPVGWRALDDARRFVGQLSADGYTDLQAALQAGLGILERSKDRGAPQMIVFLTDGLPTTGITDDALIVRLVTEANGRLEARLHVFGVGYDVNTHLLDRLAADNGGTVTYVQPGENLELALTGFYGKIARPVLTDVRVEFGGMEVEDHYPETLPDLFQGSSLLLAGRFQATSDTLSVRLRGRAGDAWQEYVYRFDRSEVGGRDFVPRLWATRRIGALLDRVRVEGETEELAGEIRELGLSYGIVTPYTTFVIEGQAEGAASTANMALYGRADLNAVSGQTTVQARVQNQIYQGATQAGLAAGANVSSIGPQSLAQVGAQQVDLALLQGQKDFKGPITDAWIEKNIRADRAVDFGSEAYLALAADPGARPFLQSGTNVLFAYQGEIIAVRDPDQASPDAAGPQVPGNDQGIALEREQQKPALGSIVAYNAIKPITALIMLAAVGGTVALLAGIAVAIALRSSARPRLK